jgi:hypothetical protein
LNILRRTYPTPRSGSYSLFPRIGAVVLQLNLRSNEQEPDSTTPPMAAEVVGLCYWCYAVQTEETYSPCRNNTAMQMFKRSPALAIKVQVLLKRHLRQRSQLDSHHQHFNFNPRFYPTSPLLLLRCEIVEVPPILACITVFFVLTKPLTPISSEVKIP